MESTATITTDVYARVAVTSASTTTTMTTTTTTPAVCPPAAPQQLTAAALGHICHPSQLTWSWDDWMDSYEGQDASYEQSVIWAADHTTCELTSADLRQLLGDHGHSVHELIEELAEQSAVGHTTLPLWHAGQALIWLGY